MKWTIRVKIEGVDGKVRQQTLTEIEREDELKVERLGLTVAEAKRLLAALQRQIVVAQVTSTGRNTGAAAIATQPYEGRATIGHASVVIGLDDGYVCNRHPRLPEVPRRPHGN